MKYQGSCHCDKIRFEVEGEIDGAVSCNCSICQRMGVLRWFVPQHRLRLLTSEENVATYTFARQAIRHRFCAGCGIHPFCETTDPEGNALVAINVRCLEGVDPDAIPVRAFDGRSL